MVRHSNVARSLTFIARCSTQDPEILFGCPPAMHLAFLVIDRILLICMLYIAGLTSAITYCLALRGI